MTFTLAIVIPIYNHKNSISDVVCQLSAHNLPIFIVDDGSNAATQEVLAVIATRFSQVRVFRLPQNSGKGAAVMYGLRQVFATGCTHALQIDADGQHDLADVPRFIEQSLKYPRAVIAGRPLYDASAPASRRYGRYATHFWVWVETLSFAIGDSMCGFRLYPLTPTLALIDHCRLPSRMDFDIEIMVRLFWMGVPVINQSTRVSYPANGLSHFRLCKDNLRIAWMHTRLCGGMLLRLLPLIWRKIFPVRPDTPHWSQQSERGTNLGLSMILLSYRLLGDTFVRLLLRLVVGWLFLSGRRAREASLDYLRRLKRIHPDSPAPTWRNSYRHMLAFANANVDKFSAWTGHFKHEDIIFENQSDFKALLASHKGAVLLGAHLGNLEIMRALAHLNGIARVNAIVYTDHAQRFHAALASADPGFEVNLLQINDMGPDTAIMMRDKIANGELLVIVGDRTPPLESGRVVSTKFLGAPALFPQGPYILASLLECPVYLFFCTREDKGYRVIFEPFAERIVLPRGQRHTAILEHAQRYADRLAYLCQRTPFQWFNFFDFWADKPTSHSNHQP